MMDGIIGIVPNIVGIDMANSVGRRDYPKHKKEAIFSDRKAREAYKILSAFNDGNLQKDLDIEDFLIDVEDIIKDDYLFIELQCVLYWHNFHPDTAPFINMFLPKKKYDNLLSKQNNDKDIRAGLIFFNCTANYIYWFDIVDIKNYQLVDNEDPNEISIKFNIKQNNGKLIDISRMHHQTVYCDCMENWKDIMKTQSSRTIFADKEYNIKGNNYFTPLIQSYLEEE